MAQSFMVSPGVNVSEFSIDNIIPSVSSTVGALAGVFRWGPIGERTTVASEKNLGQKFLTPSNFNAETWFTGSDFLSYGDNLIVVRAADVGGISNLNFSDAAMGITNASPIVTTSNTVGINVGMILFASNTTALPVSAGAAAVVSAVNSSSFTLNTPATSTVTGANVVFRSNSTFPALGQENINTNIAWENQLVLNTDDYLNHDGQFHSSVQWVARFGGDAGNSLRVAQCDSAAQFSSNINLGIANTFINATATSATVTAGSSNVVVTVTPTSLSNGAAANVYAGAAAAALVVSDLIQVGNSTIGYEFLQVKSVSNVVNTGNVYSFTVGLEDSYTLAANVSMSTLNRYWEFYNLVEQPPTQSEYVLAFGNSAAQDELHVVVVDNGGVFTQNPGEVLEVYKNVSRATDALTADGSTNYYKNVINQQSSFVWYANDRTTAVSNTAAFVTNSSATAPLNVQFYGGANGLDESHIPLGTLITAYNLFQDVENVDISLVMQGKARGTNGTDLAAYLVNNLVEKRKDCVLFVSPDKPLVVNNKGNEAAAIVNARNSLPTTSYAVLDSGYKYRYDPYNDVYRYTPLNGDIAGLCARTDQTNAPWWSPAGLNRGNIKNVVRLAYNPGKTDRDTLYKNGIDPVVTFPGQGTILYGDKTLLTKPSAFDRINVRRLFIVLEKAISTAAKYMLFEFNDAFTRAQFKSMVNPYLSNVEGQRGIYDFLVVCDSTNNTSEIVDANQFVGDIYIKPARSINFIQLNFVAVASGVSFTEVVGSFGGL